MDADRRLPPWRRRIKTLNERDAGRSSFPREPGSALGSISRSELFAILYLAGILNAVAAVAFPAIHSEGVWRALRQLPDVDVLMLATIVGVYLLRRSPEAPVERCDWLTLGTVAFLLMIPHRAASWAAVTGLALYAMYRDRRSPTAVAASSIFLMIAASSFWGLVLTQAFASTLLAWDAAFAAVLLDVRQLCT